MLAYLFLIIPSLAMAFTSPQLIPYSSATKITCRMSQNNEVNNHRYFDFLVEAMSPLKVDMDESKIVKSPRKWMKPSSAYELKKMHATQGSSWYAQDLVNDFSAKYAGDIQFNSFVSQMKNEVRVPLDRNEVFGPFKPSPLSFIGSVQKYLADGLLEGVTPLDKPMNPTRVTKQPKRFFKPIAASKIRKMMSRDPYYFQH